MASSPTPPPGAGPSPLAIGRTFVKQYYQVLSAEPEKIVKFYKPVSTFSHGQGSEPTTPASIAECESSELLKDRLFSQKSFKLDLEHGAIDAQMSLGGGVLVVVTGHMIIEEHRRAFCHTFFLNVASAPDAKMKSFYVHNDVMRFLEEEEKVKETELVEEVVQEEVVVTKEVLETVEGPAPVPAAAVEEPASVEPEVAPETLPEETPMYEPALEPEPAVEETKEDIVEEKDGKSKRKGKSRSGRKKSPSPTEDAKQPAPGSWASMVAHSASQPVPPSPSRRTEKKDTEPRAAKEDKPEKPVEQQQQGKQQQQRAPKRDPDCTLVIKNVPEGTRESEVRELFEPFAKQTKSKILGLNVAGRASLAFVDYDSPEPVLLALKDKQQFQLQGKNLELEPKMVEKSRARGAYRRGGDGSSNGFRGSGRSGSQPRRRGSGGGRGDRHGSGGGGRGGRGGK